MSAVTVAEDRSIKVPPGTIVRSARVPLHRVRLACRDLMSPAAVEKAFHRLLNNQPHDLWPAPVGAWEEDPEDGAATFVIFDGRHEYIGSLMMGRTHILVCWTEEG